MNISTIFSHSYVVLHKLESHYNINRGRNGKNILVFFLTLMIPTFPINNAVCCEFLVDILYQVKEVSCYHSLLGFLMCLFL